ncbi:MAG: hypothetical protein WBC73_14980, partial [Phormidesmis sp.]
MEFLHGYCLSQLAKSHSVSCPLQPAKLAQAKRSTDEIQGLSYPAIAVLLLATGSLSLLTQPALAQTATRDHDTGAVHVDHNAFNIETGPLENDSGIPIPSELLGETHEGIAQPVAPEGRSPNTIEITPDVDYIDHSFNRLLNQEADDIQHTLSPESLQLTTQFSVGHRSAAHAYGEGIEVSVYDATGAIRSRESVFVSGDQVKIGSDGQPLPATATLDVTYDADETVVLRVLNVREDGAAPTESGIYFARDGGFVVEDLQNGGDIDFNDGDYIQLFGGQGTAQTLAERSNISYETQVVEVPLDPAIRQDVIEETEVIASVVERDQVSEEERVRGQVELQETVTTRLGHARAARTNNHELLVYDRYSSTAQVRLGSDGAGLAGQLSPLIENPRVPPTLLTGDLTFDPTVDDNEAGLSATLSITQFLQPTHRIAQDAFGNRVAASQADGQTLLEPAGLFTNRRMVGYVPPTSSETALASQLASVNGVFEVPAESAILISPPDPQQVGPGNAAYTHNVGGLLLEDPTGNLEFVPQWT